MKTEYCPCWEDGKLNTIIICSKCKQINTVPEDMEGKKITTCMCGDTHVIENHTINYDYMPTKFLWFKSERQVGSYSVPICKIITMEDPYNDLTRQWISIALHGV